MAAALEIEDTTVRSIVDNRADDIAVEVPAGVTTIARMAFYNCYGMHSLLLPDSLDSIGHAAFCNCMTRYKLGPKLC